MLPGNNAARADRVESDLDVLQRRLGVEWPAINRARERAAAVHAELDAGLASLTSAGATLVVFGSLARGEWTSGSDIDWTVLIDGQASPGLAELADSARGWLRE